MSTVCHVLPDVRCPRCSGQRALHHGAMVCEDCGAEEKVQTRHERTEPAPMPVFDTYKPTTQAVRSTTCKCGTDMEEHWGKFVCPTCGATPDGQPLERNNASFVPPGPVPFMKRKKVPRG